jgi:hypothetical protein
MPIWFHRGVFKLPFSPATSGDRLLEEQVILVIPGLTWRHGYQVCTNTWVTHLVVRAELPTRSKNHLRIYKRQNQATPDSPLWSQTSSNGLRIENSHLFRINPERSFKTIITLKKKIVSGLNVVVVYDLLICLAWLRSGITHSFEIAL